ncbi:putative large terminase [Idiomarinaceae phage Phi1M2-2]|uniref:putative large terminase n=1 Tax=Idiomarinaceae phage Phi1M2-2 TaxID=1527515 RepID=UPI0004F58FE1|nr:putative large terminase [Idiomarinaceae phage Phi1M2-2]AIM40760.1 putative large terminase [Idiomarinaceae phage Phi1M2-2]
MAATLSAPQNIFLNTLNTKFRAYVGGFGSGKTFVGCLDLLIFASQHPGTVQGYFGSTYPSIRDIFYPTFEEAAELLGFRCRIVESNKEVHIYRNGFYYGTIICRSMDNPASIVGFKISRALVDEIDVLPKKKAHDAWNKIIARMRLVIDGVVNGIGVTTTPEGFRFVYERFKENPSKDYSMVQASTYENEEYLPPDYISSLYDTYPDALIDAYIRGKFVNMTSGSVYTNYDRAECNSLESWNGDEPIHCGMDFNVRNMAVCIFVKRPDGYHQVDEISEGLDTPWCIEELKTRYPDTRINVYPDASGRNASSKSASESDLKLLEQAGFWVHVNSTNPRVKDRVISVNKALQDGVVKVNALRCPQTAACLEKQTYDANGEPDKKSGHDHQVDAFGYPVAFLFPIEKPMARSPRFG